MNRVGGETTENLEYHPDEVRIGNTTFRQDGYNLVGTANVINTGVIVDQDHEINKDIDLAIELLEILRGTYRGSYGVNKAAVSRVRILVNDILKRW